MSAMVKMTPNPTDVNDPAAYDALSPLLKETLALWIRVTVRPARRCGPSSYGLKHTFERATGVYLLNGQFKGGMVAAGYEPVDASKTNWTFRIGSAAQPWLTIVHPDDFVLWDASDDDLATLSVLIGRCSKEASNRRQIACTTELRKRDGASS